jgi:hypothetical protein
MKKNKLSHIFIYHNYLVVVFVCGAWELICLKYYFRVEQTAINSALAEAAAKETIDQWIAINRRQQEREQKQ